MVQRRQSQTPKPSTTTVTIILALAMVTFPIAGAMSTLVTDDPTWVQAQRIAPDPEPLAAEDEFARTLATNGQTLAISEHRADTVHLYEKTTLGFEHAQTLTLDGETNARFGYDLAINENLLVVTALDAEQAHVYEPTPDGWTHVHTLSTDQAGDTFGFSVDVHENRIAIGAIHTDHPEAVFAGTVHVYTLHDEGTIQHETLSLQDPQIADFLGWDIAIHDDTIAAITNNGAAHVFEHQDGEWVQTAHAIADTGATRSIALAQDTLAVGHPRETVHHGIHEGAVTVHERAQGTWEHIQTLRAQDLNPLENPDRFGTSLTLNEEGTTLAIGAPHQDPTPGLEVIPSERDTTICRNAPNLETCDAQGAAFLFETTEDGWTQTNKFTPPDQAYGFPTAGSSRALFGASVALSPTMDNIAVGAPNAETLPAENQGTAYLFQPTLEVTIQ